MKKTIMSGGAIDLTQGSISKGILLFGLPIFLGQMLQSLYNLADAWVIGNYAGTNEFAAVSTSATMVFLIIGFCMGLATGGGVVISRYLGAGDTKNLKKSIHALFVLGIATSVVSTIIGVGMTPKMLELIHVPPEVMPYSYTYFMIYFGGVSTVVMYNICMAIMRALGDSMSPLYYLIFSSVLNIGLDVLFVAIFHWGVMGAAVATVISQGLSVVLCIIQMMRDKEESTKLQLRYLKWDTQMIAQVFKQGFPAGIQNTVISIGNIVIQSNINAFGAFAMGGHGAIGKIESLTFLPVNAMTLTLPTFVSQNLGAGNIKRAKQGALFGTVLGMALAELFGIFVFFNASSLVRIFIDDPRAIEFGVIHGRVAALFYLLLAFSHCAAGVLRGCGKSFVPMVVMLVFWCGVRVTYVTLAVRIWPVFATISWAYPLTWSCSTILFLLYLWRLDWVKAAKTI